MGIRQSNNPEGNMPYSQMFNQYQNTSPYDNQPWNEVDFTTSLPPNDNFKSIDDTGSYIERGVLEETLQGSCCVLGLRKGGNAPGIWAVVSSTWDRHEHWDLGDGTPAF